MTKPIPESRMGGLFSKPGVMTHESEVKSPETGDKSNKSRVSKSRVVSNESGVMTHESDVMSNDKILISATAQGRKDPRISAYSPLVMSILRYLRRTKPEFSMSEEASNLLEEAIRKKYPDISKQVEEILNR